MPARSSACWPFPLPAPADPDRLIDQTHTALVQLFVTLAPQLARTDRPLPHTGLSWD